MKIPVHFFTILLIAASHFIACRNAKPISYDKALMSARKEDSAHGYYFFPAKKRFSYKLVTITKENRNPVTKVFAGTYTYLTDQYSIGKYLLKYDKGISPPDFTDYLIEETSGTYLIQSFTNGKERMFLRIRSGINGY